MNLHSFVIIQLKLSLNDWKVSFTGHVPQVTHTDQCVTNRLQVVSNFCDSDRGVGKNTHTYAQNTGAPFVLPLPGISHTLVFIPPPPQSLGPKLENTRSLCYQ